MLCASLAIGGTARQSHAASIASSVEAAPSITVEEVSIFLGLKQKDDHVLLEVAPSRFEEAQQALRASENEQLSKSVRRPQSRISSRRVSQPVDSDGEIEALIIQWADYYHTPADRLLRVARCESGLNPSSINRHYFAGGGNPSGVFQFLPSTFLRYEKKAGLSGLDIFNASDNIRLAAYAFSVGGSDEWQCQ